MMRQHSGQDRDDDAGRTIEAEVRTTALPADVWRAWTSPEGLASWFVDRATGSAEPGEAMVWHWDRFGFETRLIVHEARPGERLVLESEAPAGARLTEITIRTEAGATVIRVVESGFHGPDDVAAGIESGWRMALAILRHALEVHPGAARDQVLVLRPLPDGVEPPHDLYATVTGLATWLGRQLGPVPEDDARLELPGAGTFSGGRLLDTGRECLWHWSEVPALVEMKAFPAGAHWTVGLAVSAWGAAASALAGLEPAVRAAVDRLVEVAVRRAETVR